MLELANGSSKLTLEPIQRRGGRLVMKDFDPCAVLLNNDLSAGIPAILAEGLDEQWVIPPAHAGWHSRRKSNHAAAYDRVTRNSPGDRHRPVAPEYGLRHLHRP